MVNPRRSKPAVPGERTTQVADTDQHDAVSAVEAESVFDTRLQAQ